MDFDLPEDLKMLRNMVREFADEKIAPNADEWDEDDGGPYEEVIKPHWLSLVFLVQFCPRNMAGMIWAGWQQ